MNARLPHKASDAKGALIVLAADTQQQHTIAELLTNRCPSLDIRRPTVGMDSTLDID